MTYVNEALPDLTEHHNVTTPVHDPVEVTTERIYEELEVFHGLDEPKSMRDLQQELGYSTAELQAIVSRLKENGAVGGTDDRIEHLSTTI